MHDYSLGKEEKSKYVLEVREGQYNTLEIVFADGKVFTGIEKNDKNIQRINDIQEEQAKKGLDNYVTFKRKKALNLIKLVGIGTCSALTAEAAIQLIPGVSDFVNVQNPLLVIGGVGTIAVLSAIPAYPSYRRSNSILVELNKIKYRNNHIGILNDFRNHQNALVGLDEEKVKYFESSEKPFSMLNVDSYDIEDLMKIVENIELENSLGVSYVKKLEAK